MSESIYKFVEQAKKESPRKKIYRSRHDPKGPLIGSTFGMHGTNAIDGKGLIDLKKNHAVTSSFGRKHEAPDPNVFLRKGSREVHIPSVEHHNRDTEEKKPPVPTRDDKPVQGLKITKNFITCNALDAINSSPKKRKGNEMLLHEEYGKVPSYLATVKESVEREKELVDKHVLEQFGLQIREENEVMNDAERRELINRLKQRWDDVNAMYQKYCHKVILDTPSEIRRKASQEAELKQIEDDIEKLSRPGPLTITR